MKKVLIIGAGPAGLGAAYEFLKRGGIDKWDITLLEMSDTVGGGARSVEFEGNIVDIGPHHFFTNSDYIKSVWNTFLPEQGSPSRDDIALGKEIELCEGGPDPNKHDNVMLRRKRVSRILYNGKFFDYPLSFKKDTIKKLGIAKTLHFGFSVLKSRVFRRRELTMEDYLVNKFGRGLYNEFFKTYTYKAWGDDPRNISSECGTQRIQGISLRKAIKQLVKSVFGIKPSASDELKGSINEVKTMRYPKLGARQMWDLLAADVVAKGAKIQFGTAVKEIVLSGNKATEVVAEHSGEELRLTADYVISTMPICKLFECFSGEAVSSETGFAKAAHDAAVALRYRNFVMIGIFANKLKMPNDTEFKTVAGSLPDCWSYIYNNVAQMSRFNVYNNFSPYVIANEGEIFLGIEYLCNSEDDVWKGTDEESIAIAVAEAEKIGLLDSKEVIRTIKVREPYAYPVYSGSYSDFAQVKACIDELDNVYSIGRKGQHRYLDMDQSMLTALECVRHICGEITDKTSIWEITE